MEWPKFNSNTVEGPVVTFNLRTSNAEAVICCRMNQIHFKLMCSTDDKLLEQFSCTYCDTAGVEILLPLVNV